MSSHIDEINYYGGGQDVTKAVKIRLYPTDEQKKILKVYELLEPYLSERGLILAEDKTRITHLSKGFDFLGFVRRARVCATVNCLLTLFKAVESLISILVMAGFSLPKLLVK